MTLIGAFLPSTTLIVLLLNSSARALALGVVVALALAALRGATTSLRLFTWTAVLYSALAMPLLESILPPLPVPAPSFLQAAFGLDPRSTSRHPQARTLSRELTSDPVIAPAKPIVVTHHAIPTAATITSAAAAIDRSLPFSISWTTIASALYYVVAFILLLRFCIGLILGRKLRLASQPIDDPDLIGRLRAHAAGLGRVPRAAESELISVPLTMGVLHPTILLPADWRAWDQAKLDAVLAHEVSHVARRDALTQRLSLLHRTVFWFSPLAWWLDRHLAALAEQASDEAVLCCSVDRQHYARTLLGFFEALQTSPGRVWWQGVAMAKPGQAAQRVERILSWKGSVTMDRNRYTNKRIATALLTLVLPVVYVAASAHPVSARSAAAQAPTSTSATSALVASPYQAAAPAPQSAPLSTGAPDRGIISAGPAPPPMPPPPPPGVSGGLPGPAPIVPVPPAAPMSPVGQVAPVTPVPPSHRGFSYRYGLDNEQRFVIVSGKTDSFTMSGSAEDARHVEKLRNQISGDFIWFQRDEKSYVIRDQATIDRALKLWEPQHALGKKQEELGKQQEALGKQQQELGDKMQQVRVNVPDLTTELEKLKAELKQLSAGATSDQVGHIQSEIGDLQSKIGDVQSQAGDQQGRLGEEMGALGEKQGKLGEQQGELGRQQGELAERASREMKQLLDEAISKGTAQPEI